MKNGMKLWSVLLVLTLVNFQRITAESVTQSQMEKSGSEIDAENWTEREIRIMEIAEEEIERTSQEAVKAALLEVGGELAYWKERYDLFEVENENLKFTLQQSEKQKRQIKTQWLVNGIAIGVGVSGIVFALLAQFQ